MCTSFAATLPQAPRYMLVLHAPNFTRKFKPMMTQHEIQYHLTDKTEATYISKCLRKVTVETAGISYQMLRKSITS